MEKQLRTKHTGIFVIELLIFTAVFVLSVVVSLGLFARADALSRENRINELALSGAQTVAECFKATGGDLARTASLCGGTAEQGVLTLETGEGVQFVMTVERSGTPGIGTLTASCGSEELLVWQIAALEVVP